MPLRRPLVVIAAAAALAGCFAEQDPLTPAVARPRFSVSLADTVAGAATLAAPQFSQYIVSFKGSGIPNTFEADVSAVGGTILFTHRKAGLAVVSGIDATGAATLSEKSSVDEVTADAELQLVPQAKALEEATSIGIASATDPAAALRFSYQWNMRAINAPAAWAAGKLGSPSVTVAILDTGIDYDNPDLAGLVDLSRSTSFVPSDTAYGRLLVPFFGTRHPISDFNGHGTNVATQVASNAWAFAGVTSRTTLIGVKVLNAQGTGSNAGILLGILYAADQGADIINLSLGGFRLKAGAGGQTSLYNKVMNYAKQAGSLIVVAAGNDAADLDHHTIPDDESGELVDFPSLVHNFCDAVHVLCVSAVGPLTPTSNVDEPAWYDNFGRSAIDVAAPGGSFGAGNSAWPWGTSAGSFVWAICPKTAIAFNSAGNPSTLPCYRPGFVIFSGSIGTSQAAPHVTGLAALLLAEGKGGTNPQQLKNAIIKAASDLGQRGTDPYYGKGRIDVAKALGL